MAAVVAAPATSLLLKFGQSLAGAAGSWVFKKGLEAITGGSDLDKVRKDIAFIVDQVKDVKSAVDNLSNQLSDALLQLRSDHLKASLTKINTHWDTIADIVLTAFDLPKELSADERATKLKHLQNRLVNRLQECANEVPGILDAIDSFLSETGGNAFLRQATQQALDGSTDFLGYYGKMKTLILGYWVVVVKGISLLQMAADSPDARFEEGAKTLERHRAKLLQQETVFITTVGENTIKLAELVLANPANDLAINFTDNQGRGFCRSHGMYGMIMIWVMAPSRKWWMYLDNPDALKTSFDVASSYPVRLWEDATQHHLIFSGSQYEAVEEDPEPQLKKLSRWYIKPLAPGSDRYSVQYDSIYAGKFFDRAFLVTRDIPRMGDQLRRQDTWDAGNDRLRFQITHWPN
ncbi:hypothetical protein PENSPDRAFT_575019 [Peniophora sp. CONT]|nr:hypothetical protein PENSPDRAFT_575019 [Peniophora sp. CONT]